MAILKSLLLVIVVLSSLLLVIIILLQKLKVKDWFSLWIKYRRITFYDRNVLSATVTLTIVFLSAALLLGIIFSKQDKSLMSDITEENIQVANRKL